MINNVVNLTNGALAMQAITNDSFLIEGYLSTKKAEGTKRQYELELRKFLNWIKKPFIEVTKTDMLLYNRFLVEAYPNEKTRQKIYSSLRKFYDWLIVMEYLDGKNPTDGPISKLTPDNNPNDHILTKNELKAFLSAAHKNRRNYALLSVLIFTGIRVNELCKLNWNDIKHVGNSYFINVVRKGGKNQSIGLRENVVDALLRYRDSDLDPNDSSPVFSVLYGQKFKRISTERVRAIVAELAENIGIEHQVTPHWFRHTFATLALDGGAGLRDVQEAMGHANIKTTERYLHGLGYNVSTFINLD